MKTERPKHFVPEPFDYHQELTLKIDTLTNLGIGLGRVDGWVVMVPFALPGEKVSVRVYRNHKNYSEADLLEVLEPSSDRKEPECSLFGQCGGCQYQHLSYSAQLEWKREQVVELLQKITGIESEVNATHPSPRQLHYRSKLTPHFNKRREENFPIGFLKQGQRNRIIDVEQCPIGTEEINAQMPIERKALREKAKKMKKGGTLLLRHALEGVVTDPRELISERIGKVVYQFHAGDFFQNNPFILPEFVDYIIGQAKQGGGARYLVDAYCGVGVFALAASPDFERVAGVEVNASAVKWANGNAAINHIKNCEFLLGQAEAIFAQIPFPGEETAMIIDPPRAGCDEAFIAQLLVYLPQRLVYVSCDPATQARDLKSILAGGYRIERIQPFDLFPQTRHIENVVTLVRP